MEAKELYAKAIGTWGERSQTDMCMEECAELIAVLNKFRRGRASFAEVVDELADVSIMVEQLSLLYGTDAVAARKREKLRRLEGRLGR